MTRAAWIRWLADVVVCLLLGAAAYTWLTSPASTGDAVQAFGGYLCHTTALLLAVFVGWQYGLGQGWRDRGRAERGELEERP